MAIVSARLKLEARRAFRPLIVVVVLAVCAVAVTVGLISQQTFQRPWGDYVSYSAAFDDVKGVVAGQQEVRVAGVKVGLVKSVALRDGRAVLKLAIEKKYASFYRDATFRLRPKTPLQDMYVEARRGSRSSGPLRGSDVVPATQTVTPVDVSRVLQTFDADTRNRLSVLLDGFGRGTADRGADLRQAFVALAPFLERARDVSRQLAVRKTRLARLVSSADGLTTELGRSDRQLAGLVRNGNAALSTLARPDVPLKATLRQLPGTLSALDSALTELGRAQDDLDPALRALRPAARKLGGALTGLDRLSADLRPAARDLLPAVNALLPLSRVLPPTGRALAGAVSDLRPQVPEVDLALRELQACDTAFSTFFPWTLQVGKLSDGYSAYARGSISAGNDSLPGGAPGISGLAKPPLCSSVVTR
jgi:phospholipid/cholesterol/gamma-HCH transport system substrate-binding protein